MANQGATPGAPICFLYPADNYLGRSLGPAFKVGGQAGQAGAREAAPTLSEPHAAPARAPRAWPPRWLHQHQHNTTMQQERGYEVYGAHFGDVAPSYLTSAYKVRVAGCGRLRQWVHTCARTNAYSTY